MRIVQKLVTHLYSKKFSAKPKTEQAEISFERNRKFGVVEYFDCLNN